MINGIDVSEHQGVIDFNKVKAAGVDFVIIRAGYGRDISQKDRYFETNYKKAKAAGLNVGAYWYSYADSVADVVKEAKTCLEAIKGKTFEYPIYFDLEESSQLKQGKSFCSQLVTSFCTELEKAGYYAGLYISRSPLQTNITSEVAKKYALWIAEYGGKLNYDGTYGMWQNSSTWRVNGVNGNVDHDYSYVDYPKIIKNGGYNGYKKTDAKTLDKSGYKKGDKTIGVLAFKQLLILAKAKKLITQGVNNDNVFGEGTEKAVNQLLKNWGYKQTGIAGTNFIKKLGEQLMK